MYLNGTCVYKMCSKMCWLVGLWPPFFKFDDFFSILRPQKPRAFLKGLDFFYSVNERPRPGPVKGPYGTSQANPNSPPWFLKHTPNAKMVQKYIFVIFDLNLCIWCACGADRGYIMLILSLKGQNAWTRAVRAKIAFFAQKLQKKFKIHGEME